MNTLDSLIAAAYPMTTIFIYECICIIMIYCTSISEYEYVFHRASSCVRVARALSNLEHRQRDRSPRITRHRAVPSCALFRNQLPHKPSRLYVLYTVQYTYVNFFDMNVIMRKRLLFISKLHFSNFMLLFSFYSFYIQTALYFIKQIEYIPILYFI